MEYKHACLDGIEINVKDKKQIQALRTRHIKEHITNLPLNYLTEKQEDGSFCLLFLPREIPLMPVFDRRIACLRRTEL